MTDYDTFGTFQWRTNDYLYEPNYRDQARYYMRMMERQREREFNPTIIRDPRPQRRDADGVRIPHD